MFYEKSAFIDGFVSLMKECNQIIMDIYDSDFEIIHKEDTSPLTIADEKCNAHICDFLQRINDKLVEGNEIEENSIVIISEEIKNDSFEERKQKEWCWLVDPLDGTKEFVKRNGQFTANIGLTRNGVPVFGFVSIPVSGEIYYGIHCLGSFKIHDGLCQSLHVTQNKDFTKKNVQIIASSSHLNKETQDFIDSFDAPVIKNTGSSIKLLWIAENKADVYPRIAPTSEWDTCAAHAVVKYAGGQVLQFESRDELAYNKENLLNPYFIVY